MQSLQILSLGRNLIKKIEGLEPVADTLEELWLSYNQIDKLVGAWVVVGVCGSLSKAAGALGLAAERWRGECSADRQARGRRKLAPRAGGH
jgi:hypothetical protein